MFTKLTLLLFIAKIWNLKLLHIHTECSETQSRVIKKKVG